MCCVCVSRCVRNWRPLTKAHLLLLWIPVLPFSQSLPAFNLPSSAILGSASSLPQQQAQTWFFESVMIRFDIKEKAIPGLQKNKTTQIKIAQPCCFLSPSCILLFVRTLKSHSLSLSLFPVSLFCFSECSGGLSDLRLQVHDLLAHQRDGGAGLLPFHRLHFQRRGL